MSIALLLQVWEGQALDVCQPQLLLGKPPLSQRGQVRRAGTPAVAVRQQPCEQQHGRMCRCGALRARLLLPLPLLLLLQVGHLEHLVKLYSRGDIPHCDWLDMLTFKARCCVLCAVRCALCCAVLYAAVAASHTAKAAAVAAI